MPSNRTLSMYTKHFVTFCLLPVFFLVGCASRKALHDEKTNVLLQQRVRDLTDSLNQKDWEVRNLKTQVDDLKSQKIIDRASAVTAKMDKAKSKSPRKSDAPTAKKGSADDYVVTEADFDDEFAPKKKERRVAAEPPADRTIADSKHELLSLYSEGAKLLREKKYEAATAPLREFLKLSPDHVYADHAQFLICKSYYLNREYELAVLAANRLEMKYPYSLRLPEALYIKGSSYLSLTQNGPARKAFEALAALRPGDPFSIAGSKKLAELSKTAERSRGSLLIEDSDSP